MLTNNDDFICLRDYGTTELNLEVSGILHRGLAESKPRRISYAKLVSTVVRQMLNASSYSNTATSVLMHSTVNEAIETSRQLVDVPCLRFNPPIMPALLDQLHAGTGSRIIAVLGESEKSRPEAHTQLARVFAAQSPQRERQISQEFNEALAKVHGEISITGADRRRLVTEERPGKAGLLNLSEPTFRLTTKRWQALAARDTPSIIRSPIETAEGWGVGAIRLSQSNPIIQGKDHRSLQLSSLSLRMAPELINLDTGQILRRITRTWLKEKNGFDFDNLRRVVVCTPWLGVAAKLASAFSHVQLKSPLLTFPDFVHGWQPCLTAMEFLLHPEVPALFIYTGRFPDVHLMAVWQS
jgi:hypothetical protein